MTVLSDPRVERLYVKRERGTPMLLQPRLRLDQRVGIAGDVHRHRLGPRQVLLAAAEVLEGLGLSTDALRANVITRGVPLDDLESGSVLALGADVIIRLTHRCEVCSHLGRLSGIEDLRSLQGQRGYLGVVVAGGSVQTGDAVLARGVQYNRVPDHVATRTFWVIRQIPVGRVVPYAMLVQLVGAPRSYLRALPRLVAQAEAKGLPAHRIVTSAGDLLASISDQQERLGDEGVKCTNGSVVDVGRRTWRPYGLYLRRASAVKAAGQQTLHLPAAA